MGVLPDMCRGFMSDRQGHSGIWGLGFPEPRYRSTSVVGICIYSP